MSESLMRKGNNDGQRRRAELSRASFFESWMKKLAAAYRQEISLETQVMYLKSLSDLPLDRLELAFQRAVQQSKFMPTIAEIREHESTVEADPKRMESAHARLRARIAAQPEVKMLPSALDQPAKVRREQPVMTTEQIEAAVDELLKQREQLLRRK